MKNSYILGALLSMICLGGAYAAKTHPEVTVQMTPIDHLGTRLANVTVDGKSVVALLMLLKKNDPAGLQKLIDLYNEVKRKGDDFSSILPAALVSVLPANVLGWLKQNGLIDMQGQISPAVFDALDLTYGIVQEGIENAQSKTCGAWCKTCWGKNVPKYLQLSLELVLPILANSLVNSAAKKGIDQDTLVRSLFADVPPSKSVAFDEEVLASLREMRAELRALILNDDGEFVSWDKLIKNLKNAIQHASTTK